MLGLADLPRFALAAKRLAADLSGGANLSTSAWFGVEHRPPSIFSGVGQITEALIFVVSIQWTAERPRTVPSEVCLDSFLSARVWIMIDDRPALKQRSLIAAVHVGNAANEGWGVLAEQRERRLTKVVAGAPSALAPLQIVCDNGHGEFLPNSNWGAEVRVVWPRHGLPGARGASPAPRAVASPTRPVTQAAPPRPTAVPPPAAPPRQSKPHRLPDLRHWSRRRWAVLAAVALVTTGLIIGNQLVDDGYNSGYREADAQPLSEGRLNPTVRATIQAWPKAPVSPLDAGSLREAASRTSPALTYWLGPEADHAYRLYAVGSDEAVSYVSVFYVPERSGWDCGGNYVPEECFSGRFRVVTAKEWAGDRNMLTSISSADRLLDNDDGTTVAFADENSLWVLLWLPAEKRLLRIYDPVPGVALELAGSGRAAEVVS